MRRFRLPLGISVAATVAAVFFLSVQGRSQPVEPRKGALERIKVHGASLEGNLEGDSPDRDVVVYLPPSYNTDASRRYPVIYFLHGYSVNVDVYVRMLEAPGSIDRAIAAGAREAIVVMPDAFTIYSGSMYSNSVTTGDWEGYIAHDLISYIDSHYRTIALREGRGLSGHSMGGYGTMRIGMKQPQVFGSLYAMSSCCLMNNPAAGRGAAAAQSKGKQASFANGKQAAAAKGKAGRGGGMSNALFAQAAAWAPNPLNPPQYFDLPTKDGEIQPLIAAKWVANSPLVMVDQYVPSLKSYRAIAMDVGDQDPGAAAIQQLDAALTRLGVPHSFELYEGTHTSRVRERFETEVLPFFSQHLAAPEDR